MTITFRAIEFDTADEAIQHMSASARGEAITIDGKYLVAEQAEIDRIAAAGIGFAYLHDHAMPDGTHRLVTVPVND